MSFLRISYCSLATVLCLSHIILALGLQTAGVLNSYDGRSQLKYSKAFIHSHAKSNILVSWMELYLFLILVFRNPSNDSTITIVQILSQILSTTVKSKYMDFTYMIFFSVACFLCREIHWKMFQHNSNFFKKIAGKISEEMVVSTHRNAPQNSCGLCFSCDDRCAYCVTLLKPIQRCRVAVRIKREGTMCTALSYLQ